MNTAQVIPFRFESREVRTVLINDQPWFVAKDVMAALEYAKSSNPARVIDHVPDIWKGVNPIHTPGGQQNMLMISDQGLYFFMGRSDKPKALPFQMWLAGEVLPAIRKHGRYEDTENKMAQLVNETIGQNGFKILQSAIKGKVSALPVGYQHSAKSRLWSRVHSEFGVSTAKDIPGNELEKAIKFVAAYGIEGEYIPRINPLQNPQLNLNYPDRFPGQKWLSYREMYPGAWDIYLLGFICSLEQYEGQTVPLKVTGTQVLKREIMSLMNGVDVQVRALQEINRLSNN